MAYSACEICGVASEDTALFGGIHKDCMRRFSGNFFERTYQNIIDGWWWLMSKLFD